MPAFYATALRDFQIPVTKDRVFEFRTRRERDAFIAEHATHSPGALAPVHGVGDIFERGTP
jgi:hypothetical protein